MFRDKLARNVYCEHCSVTELRNLLNFSSFRKLLLQSCILAVEIVKKKALLQVSPSIRKLWYVTIYFTMPTFIFVRSYKERNPINKKCVA